MEKLRERFGGTLGESIIGGIFADNPEHAMTVLEELANQNPGIPDSAKNRMIDDFHSQFKVLERAEIEECLKVNLFNEDFTVMALLDLIEKKNRIENDAAFRRDRQIEKDRANKEGIAQLKQLFENVPPEEIQSIMDENFGNVHNVTNILLDRIKKNEEETQLQAARARMINELSNQFCLDDKEKVKQILEANNWHIEKASQLLSQEILLRKFKEFAQMYPDLEHAVIIACLNESFNDNENIAKLNIKRDIKKRENDARQKEEEEQRVLRLKQIEAEEKERRERAKRDRELEEEKRKAEEEKFNLEQKKIAAEQRQKAEELLIKELELTKKREAEELEKKKKLEKEEHLAKLKQDALESEKAIQEMALMKSKIFNIKMKQANEKEAELVSMKYQSMKVDLAKSLRPEPGQLPGFIVPKPAERNPRNDFHLGTPTKPLILANPKPNPVEDLPKIVSDNSNLVKLTLKSNVVDWGDIVILTWVHSGFPSTSDWIGIFRNGEPTHTQYLDYNYIKIGTEKQTGSITFSAPYLSGDYEFRYFGKGNYCLYGVSESLKVGPQFKIIPELANATTIKVSVEQLTESANKSFQTWLAMYTSDKLAHSEYYSFQWVNQNGSNNFVIPKCGKWFFRLFNNTSRYDYSCSADFFVEGKDTIILDQTSDSLVITYDLKSVDVANDRPWLGIYPKVEVLSNMYEQYIYPAQSKGATRMSKLRAGEWEARLYSNVQSDIISKSNIIVIPE